MVKNCDTESKLLGTNTTDYEEEIKCGIDKEIEDGRRVMEKRKNPEGSKVIINDAKLITFDKKFHKDTIYKVFNRKQKTETFVNGEQAENMVSYTDDYVVRFDHRIEYE